MPIWSGNAHVGAGASPVRRPGSYRAADSRVPRTALESLVRFAPPIPQCKHGLYSSWEKLYVTNIPISSYRGRSALRDHSLQCQSQPCRRNPRTRLRRAACLRMWKANRGPLWRMLLGNASCLPAPQRSHQRNIRLLRRFCQNCRVRNGQHRRNRTRRISPTSSSTTPRKLNT